MAVNEKHENFSALQVVVVKNQSMLAPAKRVRTEEFYEDEDDAASASAAAVEPSARKRKPSATRQAPPMSAATPAASKKTKAKPRDWLQVPRTDQNDGLCCIICDHVAVEPVLSHCLECLYCKSCLPETCECNKPIQACSGLLIPWLISEFPVLYPCCGTYHTLREQPQHMTTCDKRPVRA